MITQPSLRRLVIHKAEHNQKLRRVKDIVVVEEPLEIRLEQGDAKQTVTVTMRTPGEDFELAAGFLFGEGVIRSKRDVYEIAFCSDDTPQKYNIVTVRLREDVQFDATRLKRNFFTTSACGVCGKASLESLDILGIQPFALDGLTVSIETILSLDAHLRKAQALFVKTGGIHASALFHAGGQFISLHEDVGRHNALDKLVGSQLLNKALPLDQHILMLSGRVSFELMQKAAMAGIRVVVAVGAPSSLAVDLAHQFNITLIGFARGACFNVYAGAARVM